ncbi:hypothetical protein M413DRAFT_31556 [Hebeloma cylindrosporum]|uniref:Uncharacterized protein n=1 Tax=Hebeloma cylindrosporum TaxID=76867 RepID=A0A0C2Y623_HEBCY|nr:hypothetical protein M413DRAFT_31556 [Hebeloma cylindrosporum h7]
MHSVAQFLSTLALVLVAMIWYGELNLKNDGKQTISSTQILMEEKIQNKAGSHDATRQEQGGHRINEYPRNKDQPCLDRVHVGVQTIDGGLGTREDTRETNKVSLQPSEGDEDLRLPTFPSARASVGVSVPFIHTQAVPDPASVDLRVYDVPNHQIPRA